MENPSKRKSRWSSFRQRITRGYLRITKLIEELSVLSTNEIDVVGDKKVRLMDGREFYY